MIKEDRLSRLPPHDLEAEQGVIGCLLLSPNGCIERSEVALGKSGRAFYDMRNQELFREIVAMHDKRQHIDMITLRESMMKRQTWEQVGGEIYVTAAIQRVPSAHNIDSYLEIVREKFRLRTIIATCTDIIAEVHDASVISEEMIRNCNSRLADALNPFHQSSIQEEWTVDDLVKYNTLADPNCLVGLGNDRETTRYLCKSYGAWLIGPSGIGKSSIAIQQAFSWALGKPFFGIRPVRPLRVLIIQSENDQGDAAEPTQGILDHLGVTPAEFDVLRENIKFLRCRGKTGPDFCLWMEREIIAWSAEMVTVDPLLRFAGIDVNRQDQCTIFLNNHLDPVLANTGAVLIGAHHTGKPKNQKETKSWSIYDHAYAGIGSSELVNWARAISILRVLPDGMFEMLLAKRGPRAWATHPNGQRTSAIFLRHAQDSIFWEQVDAPEIKKKDVTEKGRPNKTEELLAMDIIAFTRDCRPEGETFRAISKRLEIFAAKSGKDARSTTCQRCISELVQRGFLKKQFIAGSEDAMYLVGENR